MDCTIAVDDALVERFPHCIDCGQGARHIDLIQVGGQVLAVSRCPRCFAQDKTGTQLIARLAARDTPPRWSAKSGQ